MSQFVSECRKEWHRLGVPEAASNEMATDLEADLAEAQADGVAPEAVLGNGFFDPKSFAASWATARGIVSPGPRARDSIRAPSWTLALGALVCLAAAAVGLAILMGRVVRSASVSIAALPHRIFRPDPGILVTPHRMFSEQLGPALGPLGGVLLVAGLVGLGLILWLWRPWSARKRGPGFDQNIGMPSYL
jgi:hypothetical protein